MEYFLTEISNRSGIVDVLSSKSVILHEVEEVILFLLEERECLAVFVEAGLDALALILGEAGAALEVDAEVGAEFVLAGDGCVSRPVLVVLEEGALEDGAWHLRGTDRLEGINVELTPWLSHICFLFY